VPRSSDPIKKITLPSGVVRYRFVVDVGLKVKTGKDGAPVLKADGTPVMVRDQRRFSFPTRKEAVEKRANMISDKARGTLVAASKTTVGYHLEQWLAGRRRLRKRTVSSYRDSLKPVMEKLGSLELQKLSKAHLDRLIEKLLTSGRRVNSKGTALSPTTVARTITVLATALDDAMKQGLVLRNVARLVDKPTGAKKEMRTWTADEATQFLAATATDRLALAWKLSLYGLRRGEVLGLRWCDVDLAAKSLTIRKTRGMLDGQVIEDEPKSERSKRTLPLDDDMLAGFAALRSLHEKEGERAGDAYGCCPDCAEVHVVVDELGDPVHPETYSDMFEVRVRKAGLSVIRLHDTRHTCGTLMHLRGVPTAVISAWLGHSSASFTMRTYVHSQDEAMRAAAATLTGALSGANGAAT
jgi:integrase